MSIKQRIYLIIIIVMLVVSGGLVFIMTVIRDTRFEKIEIEQALIEMDRVSNVLEYSYEHYDTIVKNYSQKNEIWEYIMSENKDYEKDNLTYEMFDILDINFLSIYDVKGNIIYGKMKKDGEIVHTDAIPRQIDVDQALYASKGLFTSEEGIQYVSIGQVFNESKEGIVAGYLVMGWAIDEQVFEGISKQLSIPISFQKDVVNLPSEKKVDKNTYVTIDEEESNIIVSRNYFSYYGEEIFSIETKSSQFLAIQTDKIKKRFMYVAFVVMGILIFMAHVFHHKWISKPLN